jgi:hypothetical protein
MMEDLKTLSEFWNYYTQKYSGFNITDKGTTHDYINSYYTNEFTNRDAEINLVEIGIGDGYSMVLWREWFRKARITAIEKYPYHYNHKKPFQIKGGISIFEDAYQQNTVDLFEDNSIDYLIDDGPHTFESQCYVITNWLPKIKIGGKIIIEDVQEYNRFEKFEKIIKDNNLNVSTKIIDSRNVKGRYDDLIFEITKL